jgi:phage pi2 protein 07
LRLPTTASVAVGLAGNEMDGLQADLELGYGFTIFQAFRVSLEGFFSSKDYHQLYPTGHKWLGYLDLFGRRNISGMAEHIHADISSTTGIDFDLHHFVRSDTSSAVYKLDGLSLLGTGTKTDSRDVGTELDLTGSLKITKVLALKSGGSVFFPGQYLESEVGSRKAMKTFIEIEAKY